MFYIGLHLVTMFYNLVVYFGTFTCIMVPMLRLVNANNSKRKGATNVLQQQNASKFLVFYWVPNCSASSSTVYVLGTFALALFLFANSASALQTRQTVKGYYPMGKTNKQQQGTKQATGLLPTLQQATTVARAVASALQKAGHTATVVPSATRVSVRVKGHKPTSVLGYVPGATTQISCPYFARANAPKGTQFKAYRNYKIIAGQLTPANVQTLAITALQKAGLLPAK